MTRFCLGLSRLREHKFNYNFQNCINPLCSCGMDIESTSHFFLYCPLFDDKTITLLSTLIKIDCKLIETDESLLIETLLFGNTLFDLIKKTPLFFLNASIDYILSTKSLKKTYTTFTLEPTITDLKLIRICFKTSSNNIYPFQQCTLGCENVIITVFNLAVYSCL